MFSTVRGCEDNCERGFKRVNGYAAIKTRVAAIEAEQRESRKLKSQREEFRQSLRKISTNNLPGGRTDRKPRDGAGPR
jgi:hypothetical protein